jgi:hypothetical protein
VRVKSFTYQRSWYGTYQRQRFFSMEKMDAHVAKMYLAAGKSSGKLHIMGKHAAFVP